MKGKLSLLILIIFYFNYNFSFSQLIPENLNNNIYEFLERVDTKHIIKIETEAKPYTIEYIKQKLLELNNKKNLLTKLEKDQLKFYVNKYFDTGEFYIFGFKHNSDDFYLELSPVINYSRRWNNGRASFGRVGGLRLFTSYKNNLFIYTHLQDRGDFKGFTEINREISELRGYEFQKQESGFEYSDVISGIGYGDEKINIMLGKDYNRWGNGSFGQLILSDKVNSFPFVKFEYKPVEWLRFRYLFGTLNSKVIDSNSYYYSYPGSQLSEKRYEFIKKYIVTNLLTISPFKFVDFSAGNSHIFSRNFRLEMLLPLSFYKYLDRDVGKGAIEDGNGQLFFDLSVRYPSKFKFYGTWFIDVISLRKTLKKNYIENWFGYTAGVKIYDPLIKNLNVNVEYTKINPWVYEHKDITTTYKHLNYTLGHWIGQNADLFDISLKYFIMYNLSIDFLVEYLRKGGLIDVYYAYEGRDEVQVYFLYPPVRKDLRIKFNIQYEPVYSLIIKFTYEHNRIKDEDQRRTPLSLIGNHDIFTISFDYGFPY